jgi:hypothetical protein
LEGELLAATLLADDAGPPSEEAEVDDAGELVGAELDDVVETAEDDDEPDADVDDVEELEVDERSTEALDKVTEATAHCAM